MISFLSGKLVFKKPQFAVLETNGIGFKVAISQRTERNLPKIGSKIKMFCHPYFRQDGLELYGFLSEKELEIFELLNSVGNVGPKTALKILGALNAEKFSGIVGGGRADLLEKASKIGKKTAQRIVLELRGKTDNFKDGEIFEAEGDLDIVAALKKFGYKEKEIREAFNETPPKIKKTEERLRAVLKILAK